jgi:predicted RNA binding protein YcfA (HicA-like mRNA interferase family)
MKQWTKKEYCTMLEKNGYHCSRNGKGSHSIYTNSFGSHITVGKTINPCIARRVIKENHLNIIFLIYKIR